MVLSVEAAIADALLTHLASYVSVSGTHVAYPGIPYTPVDGKPYIDTALLPNKTDTIGISDGSAKHMGILQLSLMWPVNRGVIKPMDDAGEIIQHFRKGTLIYSNGVKVQINKQPWASPPLQEEDRVRIPISVPYTSINEV